MDEPINPLCLSIFGSISNSPKSILTWLGMLGESSETTQAARLVVVIGHGLCGGLLRSAHLGVGSLAALAAIAACNGEPRNTGTPRGYDGDVEVSKMDGFYFFQNPWKSHKNGWFGGTTILGNLQKWSGTLESTGKIQPTSTNNMGMSRLSHLSYNDI